MKVKGYSPSIAYRRTDILHYIEIWEQPIFRWVLAHLYHKWEEYTRWPMKKISWWHEKYFNGGDEFFVPLDCRRDIKCYNYMTNDRNVLAILRVTEDDYKVITGKLSKLDEPRYKVVEPVSIIEE